MTKRMRSAWITVAVLAASAFTISVAEARSSHRSHGSSGTSRSCLTGAARGLLSRIEQKFGAMQIISTCRPGARIRGTGRVSRHASGNAIDFNAGGRTRVASRGNWSSNRMSLGRSQSRSSRRHAATERSEERAEGRSEGRSARYRHRQADGPSEVSHGISEPAG